MGKVLVRRPAGQRDSDSTDGSLRAFRGGTSRRSTKATTLETPRGLPRAPVAPAPCDEQDTCDGTDAGPMVSLLPERCGVTSTRLAAGWGRAAEAQLGDLALEHPHVMAEELAAPTTPPNPLLMCDSSAP